MEEMNRTKRLALLSVRQNSCLTNISSSWVLSIQNFQRNYTIGASCFSGIPGGTSGKEPTCQWGEARYASSMPWPGRSTRVGNGNVLQYCGLGNPTDRRAWRAIESDTTERLNTDRLRVELNHQVFWFSSLQTNFTDCGT